MRKTDVDIADLEEAIKALADGRDSESWRC